MFRRSSPAGTFLNICRTTIWPQQSSAAGSGRRCALWSHYVGEANAAEAPKPEFRRVFHLVGVPKVRRDERIDISLGASGLVFQHQKMRHEVPYERIRGVLVLRGDRVYEKGTYAAAVATFGAGGFLILKKHHVDTVLFDYDNERGGRMGIVVQLETLEGLRLKTLLAEKGVNVNEPASLTEQVQLPKGSEITNGSK